MRQYLLQFISFILAALLTSNSSYAATDSSDDGNDSPLTYNEFLNQMTTHFYTRFMVTSTPFSEGASDTPATTDPTITSANEAISTAPYSGSTVVAGFGLTSMVNCAYGALLKPISNITIDMDPSAAFAISSVSVQKNCGFLIPQTDADTVTKLSKTMYYIKMAYQYKLIIEKCSRDIKAAASAASSTDSSGTSTTTNTASASTVSTTNTCSSTITTNRSDTDAAINACIEPMLMLQKPNMLKILSPSDSSDRYCLASSANVNDDCDTTNATECICDYTPTISDTIDTDTGTDLVSDYGNLLTAFNSIIDDGKSYAGYLLAKLLADQVTATSLPGMLEYDNLKGASSCTDPAFGSKTRGTDNTQIIPSLLEAMASIAASSSSSSVVADNVPLDLTTILTIPQGTLSFSFATLDATNPSSDNNKKNFTTSANVSDTVSDIISYRKDKLSTINSSIQTSSASGTTSEIMRTTALANIQWLLNKRLTPVSTNTSTDGTSTGAGSATCTNQEIQRSAAQKRYTQAWRTSMGTANNADLLREIAYTLADINRQLFENHQVQERMLVALTMMQLYDAKQLGSSTTTGVSTTASDITNYTKGSSCSDSQTSTTTDDSDSADTTATTTSTLAIQDSGSSS
jgi:hypothetical protein